MFCNTKHIRLFTNMPCDFWRCSVSPSLSVFVTNVCILSYHIPHSSEHNIVHTWFHIHRKTRWALLLLLCLCLDWLPHHQTRLWLVETRSTKLGCKDQEKIRAGARPNKDQQSVSIPDVVRYPPTTHSQRHSTEVSGTPQIQFVCFCL